MNSLHGLILAAGRGSRLGRFSDHTPKALLALPTGETLIARLIRQMFESGAASVTVVVGHMAETVTASVTTSFPDSRIRFVLAPDYASTNNVVSMLIGLDECRTHIEAGSALLFAECDVLLVDGIMQQVSSSTNKRNVAVVSPFAAGMDGTVVSLDGSAVTEVIPPRRQSARFSLDAYFKTVNVYLFEWQSWSSRIPRLLNWQIDEVGTSDYYENAIGMIVYALQDELEAHIIPEISWHEIDDLNDLRVAKEKVFPGHDVSEVLSTHGGWWDLPYIDFAYLRNMHFPPESFFAQIAEALPALLQNYGSSQRRVDEKLSWLLNVDEANLVALPGLSTIYPQLTSSLDSETTWVPRQTFGEYHSRLPNSSRYADLEWRRILETEVVNAIVLVNPNNPTGFLIPVAEILQATRDFPNTTFIVDESFISFTESPSLILSPLLPENLLVLRSMSKELGLPGIRLGFAYSTNRTLINQIRSYQPVWAFNSIAEFSITLLLKYRKEYRHSFDAFWEDKREMERLLSAASGVRVVPHVEGSFLLVELDSKVFPRNVLTELGKHRFLVKDLTERIGNSSRATTLRLAVRPRQDVRLLLDTLDSIRKHSS